MCGWEAGDDEQTGVGVGDGPGLQGEVGAESAVGERWRVVEWERGECGDGCCAGLDGRGVGPGGGEGGGGEDGVFIVER